MNGNELKKIGDWDVVKGLSSGGQGVTYVVERKGITGVAKVITPKYKDSFQARQRMHREVVNMKWLAECGLRVPQWLDDNTEEYKNEDVELFFVMSYVDGLTLDKFLAETDVDLDRAISLVENLIETLQEAHSEEIIHRDIKPENLIVDVDDNIYVLDFGVSFNQTDNEATQVTQVNETIVNFFLMLPERAMHGEDKRSVVSDITSVCGVLYYLLTKVSPKTLMNEQGQMPHQRLGGQISIDDKSRGRHLERLFDKAFRFNMRDRIQSYGELIDRLGFIRTGLMANKNRDPIEMAKAFNEKLEKSDEVTIKQAIQNRSKSIGVQIGNYIAKITPKLKKFNLHFSSVNPGVKSRFVKEIGVPMGVEQISPVFIVQVDFQHEKSIRLKLAYVATIQGDTSECTLYRKVAKYVKNSFVENVIDWSVIDIYNSDGHASEELIVADLNDRIADSIEAIDEAISGV